MKDRIATLCCVMLIQSSVVIADDGSKDAPQVAGVSTVRTSSAGALRRASLDPNQWKFRSDRTWNARQDPAPATDPDTRSWMERHPVWTGAMVGFAAGSVITYAATANEGRDEFIDLSGLRGGAILVFGGVSAGVGALAGWGVGHHQHDGYHDRAKSITPDKSR